MHDKIIMAGDNMNNVELITRENYLYLDDDCRRTYNTYSYVKIHPAFAIKNFSTSRLFKFLKKDKSYNSSAMTDLIIYGVYPNEYVHSLDLTEEETNKIMKNFISRKEHEQKEESKKAL